MKILLIDDERFVLSILQRLLDKMGYTDIACAADGKQAVTAMQSLEPNLIISDLNMPEMDGIELIRHVASLDYNPALILVSGENKDILNAAERLAKAHRLNILGALGKPVNPAKLTTYMDKLEKSLAEKKASWNFKTLTPEEIAAGLKADKLLVAFQPKVCTKTRKLLGAETLARWRDDDGKILGPGAFIPVAEKNGMMHEFTAAVIQASLRDMRQIVDLLPDIQISINVSVDNLTDVTFADMLMADCERHAINPANVIIEVTESKIMEDIIAPLDIMSRLRMKGFGLSIDDFGTGASGFQNLQILPFTELKIDRAFVYEAPVNEETRAILESIVFVAKKMGLHIVAEGVEEQAEWDLLEKLDVEIIQGFFIAKPMLIDDFLSWYHGYKLNRRPAGIG